MMTRTPSHQAGTSSPGIKDKAANTPAVIAWYECHPSPFRCRHPPPPRNISPRAPCATFAIFIFIFIQFLFVFII
jgi:hypothetical protein